MANPIRVLVVDDSSFMRNALVKMIEMNSQFKVIGTANDGKEGVAQALKLKPDVVTMDIEMPVMNGIDALKEIMARQPMPILMVSTLTEAGAAITMQALELGAVDFIPKALGNKDKNIFHGAEIVHEKLLAAASAKVGAVTAAPVAAAPAPVAAGAVQRVSAKVVIIGSSTGGPHALNDLLRNLPAHFPLPILVAQHLPATFTTALAQRLNQNVSLNVVEAKHGDRPQAGNVYIAPGGQHLRIGNDGGLSVRVQAGESLYSPSMDILAESAAQVHGKQVIGLLLSGSGNDGTRGFRQLKQQGAYLMAQDAGSSIVYGMARSAVEAGLISEVLPLGQLGNRLTRLLGV